MYDDETVISRMQDRASFEDGELLLNFLAHQLYMGQLTFVLGAGVSMGFGLPKWDALVARLAKGAGCAIPPGLSNEQVAEYVWKEMGADDLQFAEAVRKALYMDYDLSMSALVNSRLLAALGSLTMVSTRGSVRRVVSFNFDDLLERYLRYHGFDVESVVRMPEWESRADVRVYHPHGLLPSDREVLLHRGIVFTQFDYDRIVGDAKNAWRSLVLDVCRSHTCVFLGLSGHDSNLTNVLVDVSKTHVANEQGEAFWGVRISDDKNDPLLRAWETRRVYQHTLARYELAPDWLLQVCQRAAEYGRRLKRGKT